MFSLKQSSYTILKRRVSTSRFSASDELVLDLIKVLNAMHSAEFDRTAFSLDCSVKDGHITQYLDIDEFSLDILSSSLESSRSVLPLKLTQMVKQMLDLHALQESTDYFMIRFLYAEASADHKSDRLIALHRDPSVKTLITYVTHAFEGGELMVCRQGFVSRTDIASRFGGEFSFQDLVDWGILHEDGAILAKQNFLIAFSKRSYDLETDDLEKALNGKVSASGIAVLKRSLLYWCNESDLKIKPKTGLSVYFDNQPPHSVASVDSGIRLSVVVFLSPNEKDKQVTTYRRPIQEIKSCIV